MEGKSVVFCTVVVRNVCVQTVVDECILAHLVVLLFWLDFMIPSVLMIGWWNTETVLDVTVHIQFH